MYIRKRLFTVILSFLLFASLILSGYLFCETKKTARSVAADGYGYQRDIANLASSLDRISDGLQKATYASTPYRSAALAAELLAEAESARTSLASLPTYELMLSKTNEFLSRVGDYSMYLTRKAINGDEITAEEKSNLRSLAESAAELANRVSEIESRVVGENMDYNAISALFDVPDEYWAQSVETAADGSAAVAEAPNEFMALEDIFPTSAFNYDGLYSDHLKTASSAYLDSLNAVTEAEAKERAAGIFSIPPKDLVLTGDTGTKNMKCYAFSPVDGSFTVYITKQGGLLYSYSLNSSTDGGEMTVDEDTAAAKARSFLAACGYSGCEKAYWKYQGDTLFLSYVTSSNGVRIYPEEINVGVSLIDGRVTYCDASSYLTAKNQNRNHDFSGITEEEAVNKLSSSLEVKNINRAVIQSPGGNDIPCYEIYCNADDDTQIVVYINARNGAEEESLLLTENEEGYWAR